MFFLLPYTINHLTLLQMYLVTLYRDHPLSWEALTTFMKPGKTSFTLNSYNSKM